MTGQPSGVALNKSWLVRASARFDQPDAGCVSPSCYLDDLLSGRSVHVANHLNSDSDNMTESLGSSRLLLKHQGLRQHTWFTDHGASGF